MTYQNLTIIGNCGSVEDLRYLSSGVAVVNFSVACNEKWKDDSGKEHERVTWYRVACWRRLAEVVSQYLTPGRQVMVVADRIEASAYTNKAGEPAASLEITAREVKFLGKRADGGQSERPLPQPDAEHIGDIPF